MRADASSLLDFLHQSPSPYHCVHTAAEELRGAGFVELDERGVPVVFAAGSMGFVRRAGTLIAWRVGQRPIAESGFLLLGAHTDSPNLRLKPRPDLANEGYRRWGVEVYGGALLATWLDRDLGISGRVIVRGVNGEPESRLLCIDRPLARIPNLAIHLNRGVNDDGLKVNAQRHLPPVLGLLADGDESDCRAFLSSQLGGAEVLSWDLGFHDVQAPSLGGLSDEFVFSARLDNQASCFSALTALLAAPAADGTQVVVLFDHEEVGSRSHHGAMGSFLKDILCRLERDTEERGPGGLERAIARSFLVSLDMAHGV
ncbi:MAG: M18 family aminopeptidase, partial [Myxococcota bacterium]